MDLTTMLSLLKQAANKTNEELKIETGIDTVKIFTKGDSKHKYIDTLNTLLLHLQEAARIEVFPIPHKLRNDYIRERFYVLHTILFNNSINLQAVRDHGENWTEELSELMDFYCRIEDEMRNSPFFHENYVEEIEPMSEKERAIKVEDEGEQLSVIERIALLEQYVDQEKGFFVEEDEKLLDAAKKQIEKLKKQL